MSQDLIEHRHKALPWRIEGNRILDRNDAVVEHVTASDSEEVEPTEDDLQLMRFMVLCANNHAELLTCCVEGVSTCAYCMGSGVDRFRGGDCRPCARYRAIISKVKADTEELEHSE